MSVYEYRGAERDVVCGDKQGTLAGANRHRRAGHRPCQPCLDAERAHKRAYRASRPEPSATTKNRRQRNKARQRALIALAQQHHNEFRALMRSEMARCIAEEVGGA